MTKFKTYSDECKFGHSCLHLSEPGCIVKKMIDEGQILKSRYESYTNFIEILKTRKEKY